MKPCPRCKSALEETTIGGVYIDGCNACGGVWFDNQELSAVARTQPARLHELDEKFQASGAATLQPDNALQCPVCGTALFTFEFQHSPGIPVNGCPKCHGIWADNGELNAFYARIAQAKSAVSTVTARQKAHRAVGFLARVECPHCHQKNPAASQTCWACGAIFKARHNLVCPLCDKPLQGLDLASMHVEACYDCNGVWLDQGELPRLMQLGTECLQELKQKIGAPVRDVEIEQERRPHLLCPVCSEIMTNGPYSYNCNARVDNCTQCHGIWVCSDELEQMSQYFDHKPSPLP